jgi:hypothetical protein
MDKLEDDYNKANIVIETLENQRISLVEKAWTLPPYVGQSGLNVGLLHRLVDRGLELWIDEHAWW